MPENESQTYKHSFKVFNNQQKDEQKIPLKR